MSVVARKIRSVPVRSAGATWDFIGSLLVPDGSSPARREIESVTGVASTLISSEAMRDAAIVCTGEGPRVRIYCLYDDDAIDGEQSSESNLPSNPTQGEWKLSLPCPGEDLEWVRSVLKNKSRRITARDLTDRHEASDSKSQGFSPPMISKEAFSRP